MNEKALEAAAQELAAWIGYAYEGLQDRDISAEFSDWCYNGIGDRGMQGGKPAVRKACQRIVSSYLAAAPGEYAGLMERLRMDVEPTDGDMEDAADAIATLSAKLAAAEARARDAEIWADCYGQQVNDALAREAKLREALTNPPRHRFWGAGEPDCPSDIKARNGELHTLRCKVCGVDDPKNEICLAAIREGGDD